jgi:hypothetical protein
MGANPSNQGSSVPRRLCSWRPWRFCRQEKEAPFGGLPAQAIGKGFEPGENDHWGCQPNYGYLFLGASFAIGAALWLASRRLQGCELNCS